MLSGAESGNPETAEPEGKAGAGSEKEKAQKVVSCPSESSASSEDSTVSPDKVSADGCTEAD